MNKVLFISLMMLLAACQSLIEIDNPKDQFTNRTIFEDDATATSAIRGIYAEMANAKYFSNGGIALLSGLSSDELITFKEEYADFYRADLKPNDALLMDFLWQPAYRMIYNTNAALKGLNNSRGTTKATRRQLIGEALFIRAFHHFYLTNLFGPIPLLTEESFERNAVAARSSQGVVYDTIEADLIKARDLLSESSFAFTKEETGRIRPSSWAASALLARTYLYRDKWVESEEEATRVIERTSLFALANIEDAFKVASHEAIWQLKANTPNMGSWDAMLFLPSGGGLSVALCSEIVNTFEPGDRRQELWIGSQTIGEDTFYYPAKYKIQNNQHEEYHMELRLAELYLVRAEARARRNDLAGALADLNVVRTRAGLHPLTAPELTFTAKQVITAILQERRTEFFAEGGHRWLDLNRLANARAILSILPDKTWQDTDTLYPIPQSEIEANPNLAPQNDGY
jgi:starch-binding outer membrane protein, SusD/RagB family